MPITVVDPEPWLPAPGEESDLTFARNLPTRDKPRCGADPSPAALADAAEYWPEDARVTTCLLEPGHAPRGATQYGHIGLLITTAMDGTEQYSGWQWLATRRLGELVPR